MFYEEICVTGEKFLCRNRGSNPVLWTLPRRYKSRLVPQGSTSVSCTCTYTWWHSPPPTWNSSLNFLGVRESREMNLEEFYAHMWDIYGGRQM